MLKGRESLIRLIGKRRRLSGDLSVILSALPPLVMGENESKKESNQVTMVQDEEEDVASISISSSDLVHCPVCRTAVSGGDQAINTHLDFCLVKGKKRKLTQSTLFQLKYSPKAKFESNSPSNNTLGFGNQMGPTTLSFIKDSDRQKSENLCVHATCEDQSVGNWSDEKVDSLYQAKMPPGSNISTSQEPNQLILETLIVGRRFSIEKELLLGTSIILVRDPDNIKDSNAIKVLSADPGCAKFFGYISRDLSKYLSPLIEKFSLSFEGCVTSAPEHIFGPVPIRISCLSPASSNMNDSEVFRSLWANVVHVVESAKTNPTSGKTKYQENLCLLIKEVLQDNVHLFTADELSFLESFLSLSNDCQRLFVRLYMRKGPWFRLSTMSYVEILNIEEAAKELSERGYFRLSSAELPLDDLKKILNVLAIPDLLFVQNIFDKQKSHSSRKQDIIASLVSSYEGGQCPCLPAVLIKKFGSFVTISETAEYLFWRAERLFFLNGEQDLSAFLFADLQIIKYPAYNCITTDKIFRNRSDMLSFEEAIKVAQIMDQSIEENDSVAVAQCIKMSELGLSCLSEHVGQSETTFLSRFSASWVYSKVVFLGISFLEKEHR